MSAGSPCAARQLNEAVINVDTWLYTDCVHTAVMERLSRGHRQQTYRTSGRKKKSTNYRGSAPKWLLATRQGDISDPDSDRRIHPHSRIYMHGVFPFRLFDYFVDAVIVRPPLISSIYSPAMPEGHLGKFLQTLSIHQDGRQHDLNLNMSLRQNTNKWRQASSAF